MDGHLVDVAEYRGWYYVGVLVVQRVDEKDLKNWLALAFEYEFDGQWWGAQLVKIRMGICPWLPILKLLLAEKVVVVLLLLDR